MGRSIVRPVVPPLAGEARRRNLPASAAFDWLRAGWRDSGRPARRQALPTALAVFVVSVVIVWGLFALGLDYILFPALAGFMVVGPLLAIGLYEKSRAIEAGDPVSLAPHDLRQGEHRARRSGSPARCCAC